MKKIAKKSRFPFLKGLIWGIVLLFLITSFSLAALVFYYSANLPPIPQLLSQKVSESTKIYDRTGQILLYEINGDQKRTSISFDQIPQTCKDATIAIEDQNFYQEPAFDVKAILRAFFVNLISGQIVQGGSTITQQLIKNAFLSNERTFSRKIKEIILGVQLERHYSKDQILNLYFNQIPYGSNLYGIEAASRAYFGKSAQDLTLSECAILASLPRAPTYYSPWGNHQKELFQRQKFILGKMYDLGKISKEDFDSALKSKIAFLPPGQLIKAPHFVLAVQDYLIQKYGEDLIRNGGLTIQTTLDWNLEQLAEKAVLDGAKRNKDLYGGYNSALVAEDASSGQILAMAGSKDYFGAPEPDGCTPSKNCKFEGNFNVATQGLRQPGSALKPFVYLTAFEKGYTPDTVIFDVPTEFTASDPNCPLTDISYDTNQNQENNGVKNECFHPQNFDNQFIGPVSFKDALAQSRNLAAVKVLYLAGLQDVIDNLHKFGISTLNDPNRYGLSLVLGGGEVKLVDLIHAYSVLAQEGIKHKQSYVLSVKDPSGNILESYQDNPQRVVDVQYPQMINNILSDADLRSELFSSSLPLTVFDGYDVALKTGTTNDYRDAWSIGYTPSLVVGVWTGNNDNSPMVRHGTSILAAVPIWNQFMKEALKNYPLQTFNRPSQVIADKPILNGDYTAGNQIHSILYYVDPKNPLGPVPSNPASDSQFYNWELPVLLWMKNNIPNYQQFNQAANPPLSTYDTSPQINIVSPKNGDFIAIGAPLNIQAQIQSTKSISQIDVYLNGQLIKEIKDNLPNNYSFNYTFVPNLNLQNVVEILAKNQLNLQGKAQVIIYEK